MWARTRQAKKAHLLADGLSLTVTIQPEQEPVCGAGLLLEHGLQRRVVVSHSDAERGFGYEVTLWTGVPLLVGLRKVVGQQVAYGREEGGGAPGWW
jgi:hypothetical protein